MAPTAPFLIQLLKEFPFQEGRLLDLLSQASHNDPRHIPAERWPRSFRAHLACMVAMVCPALLPKGTNKLGFAYSANTPRTGKTLCAQTSICPVYGWPAGRSWPVSDKKKETNEDELRKVMDAAVLEGSPYIFFDNVKALVDSPALEGLMTLPTWTGRIMGSQKTFQAAVSIIPILTGNNLRMSTDMVERFLQCDFFVEQAEAMDRAIEHVMETRHLVENRNAIFDAVFGLIQHWDAQGRPGAPGRVRRGFETFGNIIGGIVGAAGFGDLFERRSEESGGGNNSDNDMRKLVFELLKDARWRADVDHTPVAEFTFHEIVQTCYQLGFFNWVLEGKEQDTVRSGKPEFHMTQSANAKLGALLRNYAPEQIGRTWELPHNSRIRLQTAGQGRSRKYVTTLHLTPRGRLHQLLLRDNISHEALNAYLAEQDIQPLDTIADSEIPHLLNNYRLIKSSLNPSFRDA